MNFILAQILGGITTASTLFVSHLKNIRAILAAEIMLNVITTLSFFLLPTALSGFLISVFACIQTSINMAFRLREKTSPVSLCVIFSVIYAACALSAWSSPIDLLPAVAGICFSVSVHQSSPTGYRLCVLCRSSAWILYCLLTSAYSLMLTNLFMLLSAITAMVRNRACVKGDTL